MIQSPNGETIMSLELIDSKHSLHYHNSFCYYLNLLEEKLCSDTTSLSLRFDENTEYPISIDMNEKVRYHLFSYDDKEKCYHFISAESIFFHCAKKKKDSQKHYSKAADLAYIESIYDFLKKTFICSMIFDNSMKVNYRVQLVDNLGELSVLHVFTGLLGYSIVFNDSLELLDVSFKSTTLSEGILNNRTDLTLNEKICGFDFYVSYYYNHDFKQFIDAQVDIQEVTLDSAARFLNLYQMLNI